MGDNTLTMVTIKPCLDPHSLAPEATHPTPIICLLDKVRGQVMCRVLWERPGKWSHPAGVMGSAGSQEQVLDTEAQVAAGWLDEFSDQLSNARLQDTGPQVSSRPASLVLTSLQQADTL